MPFLIPLYCVTAVKYHTSFRTCAKRKSRSKFAASAKFVYQSSGIKIDAQLCYYQYTSCDKDYAMADTPAIWFNDLEKSTKLTAEQQYQAIKYAFHALNNKDQDSDVVLNDVESRIIFLSVVNHRGSARVELGCGKGIQNALAVAIKNYRQRYPGETACALKVDFVTNRILLRNINLAKPIDIDLGLEGIAFSRALSIAFNPEEVRVDRLINNRRMLRPKNILKKLIHEKPKQAQFTTLLKNNTADFWTFRTQSIYYDGSECIELYRGHRIFKTIDKDLIYRSAQQAGDYLVRVLDEQGRFDYRYRPLQNKFSQQYNILRHAGSIYALLELYEATKKTSYLNASKRALQYLLQNVKPDINNPSTSACVVENDYIKLGGNALALLALTKFISLTGQKEHLDIACRLASWIKNAQDNSGKFIVFKQSYSTKEVSDFESEYYPGEAIYALASLYPISPNAAWINVAENAALYLINQSKKIPIKDLIHDHWLLYGLTATYKLLPNPAFVKASERIVQSIIGAQIQEADYLDWNGGYYNPPRTTPTSIRMEGLCAAYELAKMVGNRKLMNDITDCVIKGVRFILHAQYQPESAMYFKKSKYTYGAFRASIMIYEVRIDYVQHAISALLGLYRIL